MKIIIRNNITSSDPEEINLGQPEICIPIPVGIKQDEVEGFSKEVQEEVFLILKQFYAKK